MFVGICTRLTSVIVMYESSLNFIYLYNIIEYWAAFTQCGRGFYQLYRTKCSTQNSEYLNGNIIVKYNINLKFVYIVNRIGLALCCSPRKTILRGLFLYRSKSKSMFLLFVRSPAAATQLVVVVSFICRQPHEV